jgi:hypothetical protein
VHFGFNSASLIGGNATSVDAAAAHLRVHADSAVEVDGPTDPIGSDADNEALGLRRAQEVHRVLVGAGVEPSRVRASSASEQQLLTRDPKRFSVNRRVELVWRSEPAALYSGESEGDTGKRRAFEQADRERAAGRLALGKPRRTEPAGRRRVDPAAGRHQRQRGHRQHGPGRHRDVTTGLGQSR